MKLTRALAPILCLLALAPGRAEACSCVATTAEEAFEGHDAVFEGRVLEVRRSDDPAGATVAVLEVVQHWKGIESERVEVSTPAQGSMCGVAFEVDTSWMIYAARAGDALTTGLCSRTRPMAEADEDRAFLGAGVVPVEVTEEDEVEPPAEDEPPARGGCGSCAAAPSRSVAGPGLLFAALGLWITRRSRSRPPGGAGRRRSRAAGATRAATRGTTGRAR